MRQWVESVRWSTTRIGEGQEIFDLGPWIRPMLVHPDLQETVRGVIGSSSRHGGSREAGTVLWPCVGTKSSV